MLTLNDIALSTFEEDNQALKDLYDIFSETLNKNLTYPEFCTYYFGHKPHYMDITFMKSGTEIIGFICVTFYKHQLGNKSYTICRGATGIKEEYRGGNFPSRQLSRKYISYKLTHPFEKIYIAAFVANPLVYSMICKNIRLVYPRKDISTPPSIMRFRETILEFYGLREKVIAPYILKIHFQVQMSSRDQERIFSSDDKDVLYYLDMNPQFMEQIGVLTIVPVTWRNVTTCAIRSFVSRPLKKFARKRSGINTTSRGMLLAQ